MKDFGEELKPSLHGSQFGKPCKFPFRVNKTLFYGCIWSSDHDAIGPWCFTETVHLHSHTHSPIPDKWGICSDTCPIEDCPPCEKEYEYNGKHYTGCTNEGWTKGATNHFGSSQWCYTDKQRYIWKFCSNKCVNQNRPTNFSCDLANHERYHSNRKMQHIDIFRYYENLVSSCKYGNASDKNGWCPLHLDHAEKAICKKECL